MQLASETGCVYRLKQKSFEKRLFHLLYGRYRG